MSDMEEKSINETTISDYLKKLPKGVFQGVWYGYVSMILFNLTMLTVEFCILLCYQEPEKRSIWIDLSHTEPFNIALEIGACIFAFTFFYCLLSVLPLKKWIIAVGAQVLLMLTVWLYIVYEQDWNFKIVTIDRYMIHGWTASLYCLVLYLARKMIFKALESHTKGLRVARVVFNCAMVLIPAVTLYILA